MKQFGIPILMYHRISTPPRKSLVKGHYVPTAQFSRQLRLLELLNYKPLSLSEAISILQDPEPNTKKHIVLTFDDGYENFFNNALPILSQRKWPSCVFLVTSLIGKSNIWDQVLGDQPEPLMSEQQILEAQKFEVEFGSHTRNHVDLSHVNEEEEAVEIRSSREDLERLLKKEITLFCYPYGKFRSQTPQMVREAGYRAACSTIKGINTAQTDPMLLRRINVRRDTWTPILFLKLVREARRCHLQS